MISSPCALPRGFFILRRCENPAVFICGECQRPVCAEHARVQVSGPLCAECTAASQNWDATDCVDDLFWPFYYRNQFYEEAGFTPVPWDSLAGGLFDEKDKQTFEEQALPTESEEEGPPTLMDS